MPLVLRQGARRIGKAQQKDYRQHPHTALHAHVHPSSCNPFVGQVPKVYELPGVLTRKFAVAIGLARIESVRGKRRLVVRHVHLPPLVMLDARPDLRRGLAFASWLVRVNTLPDAHTAAERVFAGKAIEPAAVSMASIAVAIARLLIEDFFDPRRDSISVLHHYIR